MRNPVRAILNQIVGDIMPYGKTGVFFIIEIDMGFRYDVKAIERISSKPLVFIVSQREEISI